MYQGDWISFGEDLEKKLKRKKFSLNITQYKTFSFYLIYMYFIHLKKVEFGIQIQFLIEYSELSVL